MNDNMNSAENQYYRPKAIEENYTYSDKHDIANSKKRQMHNIKNKTFGMAD